MQFASKSLESTAPTVARRGAFSLVELLVVLVIIVMIIAIVVPSLSGARDLSKRSATEQTAARLSQAMTQFQTDKRRLPGYFSPREMGAAQNMDVRGMSAMENVMLELTGVQFWTNAADVPGGVVAVQAGPTTNKIVHVNLASLGLGSTGEKAYFTPERKFYTPQLRPGGALYAQFGVLGHTGPDETDAAGNQIQLPDLLDAFGNPFLLWMEDETATGRIDPTATATSGTCRFVTDNTGTAPAKYYWGSNAAFLKATAVGQKQINYAPDGTGALRSMIGINTSPTDDQLNSLAAMLGNPSFPSTNPSAVPSTRNILPSAGRGKYIIHSAGINRIYAGSKEKIASQGEVAGGTRRIFYGMNFRPLAAGPATTHLDSTGKPTTDDILKYMDDILIGGGN